MKLLHLLFSVFILVTIQSCKDTGSEITFHKPHEPSWANTPFSDAVEIDGLMFLTGQIGKDHKTGNLVSGGIKTETKQTIENI